MQLRLFMHHNLYKEQLLYKYMIYSDEIGAPDELIDCETTKDHMNCYRVIQVLQNGTYIFFSGETFLIRLGSFRYVLISVAAIEVK